MPKISVIMPVYNGERFLEQAIDSLLAQTFQNWELIVVDDGSKDRTAQILEQYTDQRIKVFRQENRGEACARNTGLKQMMGEYIAFLDADDIYLPNALQDLSSFLDTNPQYDVVYSNGLICDSDGLELMHLNDVRPGFYSGKILDQLVVSSSVITVPVCTMTRRSKIEEYSVRFDQNLVIGPDWDFWIQLGVHAYFGFLDKITCKYRTHPTNITRTTVSEKRRTDEQYRRMKVMNAEWFDRLSMFARESFFFDLIDNTLSGDFERQQEILQSPQFATISASGQAKLWRIAGIDALKGGRESTQVNSYFQNSLALNPGDHKSRLLIWALSMGYSMALLLVNLWHLVLEAKKKVLSMRDPRTERLQKILGLK